MAFSAGQEGHTSQRSSTLVALKDQISEGNILWLSSLNLTNKPYNSGFHKILEQVYVKYVLSKSGLILKTVATFVQKAGLISQQGGFLLRLFSTKM